MAVVVHGFRELQMAFAKADRDTKTGLRSGLRQVAEPVRSSAEQFARARIRNIGTQWPRMRVGVTRKVTYVAPRQRSRGGHKRPNLARMLAQLAMEPALERHESEVERSVERLIDRVADGFN